MDSLSRLRIVVTGLAATFPFGGVFWDYLQYVVGFMQLGHEVLYLEDTGNWCYDPEHQTHVESGARNVAYLARELPRLRPELKDRWFFRDPTGANWGQDWATVVNFCRSADLFVHISASCKMRDEYFTSARTAFIDSDPVYTQATFPDYVAGRLIDHDRLQHIRSMLRHDVFFTFAENIANPDCLIPRQLFDWIPTRQPVVIGEFDRPQFRVPLSERRRVLTTVMSWGPHEAGPIVEGVKYGGKSTEFPPFMELPRKAALPLEIAINGSPPREELLAGGWRLVDAYQVSRDPRLYRQYLAGSFGEWSVAKNAYVRSRSGWFSCRSAGYLALGVPAVVQDTGFGCALPTGEGILKFSTPDEALTAIESLVADPQRHARAARDIASEYFDSNKVLSRLIAQAA